MFVFFFFIISKQKEATLNIVYSKLELYLKYWAYGFKELNIKSFSQKKKMSYFILKK